MSLFDVEGRVVVVVGATSGLGRCVALAFARAGAVVVGTGRRVELVEGLASEIASLGALSLACPCDVLDRSSVEGLRDAVLERFGRVDILVNAAGMTRRTATSEVSAEEWDSIFRLNLTGALTACQVFLEPLKASGRGRIVNIASVASFVAFHEVAAYSASKSALLSLTRSLGCEWAQFGIRTNAVVPGVFVTDLNRALLEGTARGRELLTRTPLGRFGDPDEVAGAVLFLASDAASYISGTSIAVDGGFLASGVNS